MTAFSLRRRLLLAAGVFSLTAMALAAVGLALLFERHVTRWADGELNAHMDRLIAGIELGTNGQLVVERPPADPRFERPLSGLYWEVVIEPHGPTHRSRSLWDFEIKLPPEAQVDDSLHHYHVEGPGGSRLYLVQRRVELSPRLGSKSARVAVALDAAQLSDAVWRFTAALAPFLLVLAALLTAAAWAQVTVGLRPLSAIRDRLAAVASGDKSRLGTGFPDEVQPLANEMDALLAARERQVEKARGRAADLAHGLKTPLQVLAGDIARLNARGETEIAGEIEKVSLAMQRHVDRELARARMAAGELQAASNVAAIADSVVRVVRRTPDGERLGWTVDVPASLQARIDAADLAEALGNLVENAARHAASRVVLNAEDDGRQIIIRVMDDGPGIPEALRDEVVRRGRRLDTSSVGGAGLGLAIVADIVETWNGHMRLLAVDAEPVLFCVALTLPAAAPR